MGCWNHTCAVTNLPIFCGEEVEVILLKDHITQLPASTPCNANEYYTPIPLTFTGIYNDYGAVEECHGPALDVIIEEIRAVLVEKEKGDNEYTDPEVKREDFDVDMLFALNHIGNLRIYNRNILTDEYDIKRLSHIVVRKEVYDAIVERTSIEYWKSPKTEHLTYFNMKNRQDEFLAALKENEKYTDYEDETVNLAFEFIKKEHLKRNSYIGELLSYDSMGCYGMNRPISVIDILCKYYDNGLDFSGILDNALRFSFFDSFMHQARKSWVLPSGAGSQSTETYAQELCAKLTLSSAARIKEWLEE